jgi:hypothetical protein
MAQAENDTYASVVATSPQGNHIGPAVTTSIPEAPVTIERKPFLQPENDVRLPHTGMSGLKRDPYGH